MVRMIILKRRIHHGIAVNAAVDEATTDLLPVGGPGVGTFADLGVDAPDSILAGGAMVDHLRWLRAGGYDVGTTSGRESTGGAGFGASVS